ncbi:MAG: hypothetical protein LBD25_02880 [Coriobacteriales bacterium]|jgi:hypothetical protein|nr:hypothetical protein [Coriobacteriales bacterium]
MAAADENNHVRDEHLQFAYEACKDDNAYTSDKTICQIIADARESLYSDKVEFVYTVFPSLKKQ